MHWNLKRPVLEAKALLSGPVVHIHTRVTDQVPPEDEPTRKRQDGNEQVLQRDHRTCFPGEIAAAGVDGRTCPRRNIQISHHFKFIADTSLAA